MELEDYYEEYQMEILTEFGICNGYPLDEDSLFRLEETHYEEIMELTEEWYMENKKNE